MSSILLPERRYCTEYEVEIVEQPAPRAQRFRYATEVEGSRSQGSIPGVSSRPDCLTYPSIVVVGKYGLYQGPIFIIVCLVNPENDLVHPHTISGRTPRSEQGHRYVNKKGVLCLVADGPEVTFKNVGIICVKSKSGDDINAALQRRIEMRLDPFKKQFQHMQRHELIDFSAVRLCFNVFLPGEDFNEAEDRHNFAKYTRPLKPKCSNVIYDTKKFTELKILRVNPTVPVKGEMLLFCEKFTGTVPDVIFERDGWRAKAKEVHAHKRYGLYFMAPPYEGPPCDWPIQVHLYLQKTNTKGEVERSEPVSVEYIEQFKTPPKDYLELIKKKPQYDFSLLQELDPMSVGNCSNKEWLQPATSAANPHHAQVQAAPPPITNQVDEIFCILPENMLAVEPGAVFGQPELQPLPSLFRQGVFSPERNNPFRETDQTPSVLPYNNPYDNFEIPEFDLNDRYDDDMNLIPKDHQTPYDVGHYIEQKLSGDLKKQQLNDDIMCSLSG